MGDFYEWVRGCVGAWLSHGDGIGRMRAFIEIESNKVGLFG